MDQYNDPLMGFVRKNDFPIHIEKDKWTFVDSMEDADVIPILRPPVEGRDETIITLQEQINYLGKHLHDKWLLILMHTHISESTHSKTIEMFANEHGSNKVLITTSNLAPIDKHIYVNHNFNFVKAHFSQYAKFDLKRERLWTMHCDRLAFKLNPIKPFDKPSKKFLSPNIVRLLHMQGATEFKNYARAELSKRINPIESYFSDADKNIWLETEQEFLLDLLDRDNRAIGIIPIKNHYYENSLISVFVETIGGYEYKNLPVRAITEKTYIPLIKGHFILPFSYPGIIEDLKNQGYQFPKWINYDYDKIQDNHLRLQEYFKSYSQLQKMSLSQLTELANNDIEIRKHNKRIIVKSPFDSLHDKIKKYIEKL